MNHRKILNIIGRIVSVEAAFMLPALLISAFRHERASAIAFAVSMAAGLVLGLALGLIRPKKEGMFAREGFVTVGIAWIAVSVVGALPFLLSGAVPNFIDCLFETVSGFTTTGASVIADVEALPRGLLYWRSFTHWLGGMGVLVFVLALSPLTQKDSGESMHLLRAESPGIKISKLVPRMKRSASILYAIYIVMTLLQIVLLLIDRLPLFDAVTLSFGTAGTGGFGIKNDSLASYSAYTQWVIAVFMMLFAVNFNIFYLILIGQARDAFKNEELRAYLVIIAAAVVTIMINSRGFFTSFGENLRTVFFQVSSLISSTGYSTADFDAWPQLSRTVLIAIMIVGACAGSTGGGAKVIRILVMFRSAARSIHKALHPTAVKLIHVDGEVLDRETVSSVNTYMALYFIILAAATLLISVDGMSFETNFTASLACLSNIGPGFGAVGPTCNFGGFSAFSKLVLTFVMLVGRLEIYPMLMLFVPSVWRK
jgi:trk system potassium uptake protein TrkH